ncbi:hypothetical protein SAMN05216559_1473 [Halomicrobium zhouii]|uniref:Uncharacterized protein n=1 Tax=Halomicrobium zhouii TaxID=767519 RepID=A0A1I6KSP3_9EURY|nr:hypothetical protein [Halomicrobium zhouii]SFR94211.1 hypothetical protein SAMN05216559_1473 [Halomicrobium zhouii]
MGSTDSRRGSDYEQRTKTVLGQLATLAVVVVSIVGMTAGVAAADVQHQVQQQETNGTYAVVQGEDCTEISPLYGNESVKSFYDYRSPIPENPSTNQTGRSYSSKGTIALQQPDTSSFFLYEDSDGNLSLVFLHGSTGNASDGGAATFTIAGLPEDGNWTVKDDSYDGKHNYDSWREADGVHRVDWTWGESKTDGGAYTGLGEEFTVTIDPAFNTDAELYGQQYNGTIRYWTAISNGQATYDRTSLTAEQVTITSEGC